ncbi:DUF563 domain-containing protein [Paenibacillus hodogayensis]|uniref:DUF563 domain-containing protein n=1 Tax=Paenibacillus hodogayensis TaxID=279208 RepID=A0ABV5VSW9_9BACL
MREVPTGVHDTLMDWIREAQAAGAKDSALSRVLFPARSHRLTVPHTVDPALHPVFAERLLRVPEAYVGVIPGGRFWADKDDAAAVITPDNKLIRDVSLNFLIPDWPHPVFRRRQLGEPMHRAETVAVVTFVWSRNYFHWMTDVIGRIRLLEASGLSIDKYIIAGGETAPFQLETLAMLGIGPERIIRANEGLHLQAERLVVPSLRPYRLLPFTVNPLPRWSVEYMRERLTQAVRPEPLGGYERIYISRGDAKHRRVLNEPDVVRLLAAHGFRTVALSGMKVAEQIRLFASARTIVAPHGASLTNLMFCRPGTRVVDIFAPNYMYPCFWHISSYTGLDYYYLIGQGRRLTAQEGVGLVGHVHDDLTVDLAQLAAMLRLLGP